MPELSIFIKYNFYFSVYRCESIYEVTWVQYFVNSQNTTPKHFGQTSSLPPILPISTHSSTHIANILVPDLPAISLNSTNNLDLYLKTEQELLDSNFIASYATLVHRNILHEFLIPSPNQQADWGKKHVFLLKNPQPVNLALATGKLKIADQIINEVEKRKPRGYYAIYPSYGGRPYPLPPEYAHEEEEYEQNLTMPTKWIEHQFVTVSVLFGETTVHDFRGIPAMGICVLTHSEECMDLLHYKHRFKSAITSNATYTADPVILAAKINAYELVPKLVDIGAPFDMRERSHILSPTSPFLYACAFGSVEFVEKLYQMGWDIDEQNEGHGDTCLHVAAQSGFFRLTAWLLEHGADITMVHEKDGQSAYSLAVMYHQHDVQGLIGQEFLRSRLPLPKPPTPSQMLMDFSHHDQVGKYLTELMERRNETREEFIEKMDMVVYDPYYDFNGSYDPNAEIGNPDVNLPADQMPGAGHGGFTMEIDGVTYRAGTYTYRQKVLELKEKEKIEQVKKSEEALREYESLMAYVDNALKARNAADLKNWEVQKTMPAEMKHKVSGAGVERGQTTTATGIGTKSGHSVGDGTEDDDKFEPSVPAGSEELFTTKLIRSQQKKAAAKKKDEL